MKRSLVFALLGFLMPSVLAGLTAIVESPPISDPLAEFHRFDLYLSSHGDFAIDADSLNDDNWVLAVPSAFRRTPLLSAKGETLSPRLVTFQTLPDDSSVAGRSLRVTYEITRPEDGWESLPARVNLDRGPHPVKDTSGATVEGTSYPLGELPIRLPRPFTIHYQLIGSSGEANAKDPQPVERRYLVTSNFPLEAEKFSIIAPRVTEGSSPAGPLVSESFLEAEIVEVVPGESPLQRELAVSVHPHPEKGWGEGQRLLLPIRYEKAGLHFLGHEPVLEIIQPEQTTATLTAKPIPHPDTETHRFQLTLHSPSVAPAVEQIQALTVKALGGYREERTLLDLGHLPRSFVDRLDLEASLLDASAEQESKTLTLTYEIQRPPSGWRVASTETALPVSLAPMRDAKGRLSVFPSVVGYIPLAFAETEQNPTMDFASWAAAQSLPSLSPPGLDGDGDGFLDLMEFAMGTNPKDPIDSPRFEIRWGKHQEQTLLRLTYDENVNARGLKFGLQASTDGATWENVRGHFRLHQRFQLHPHRRSVRLHSIRDLSELPWKMFRLTASVE